MSSILKWIVGVGAVWFAVTLGLTAYLTWLHASSQSSQGAPAGATPVGEQVVTGVLHNVMEWGAQLGHFIAPIVQIALIIMIMIAAAEQFGFTAEKRLWSGFAAQEAVAAGIATATQQQPPGPAAGTGQAPAAPPSPHS